jgi:hypothetical protein
MNLRFRDVCGAFRREPALTASDDEIGKQRDAAEDEVREHLGETEFEPAERADYLQLAMEGYQEQGRRAERSERRATTLLASVSIVTALLGAAATALAGSDLLRKGALRIGFAVAIAIAIALFGLAALWAAQVLTVRDQLRQPSTPPMLLNRASRRGDQLYVDIIGALIDSIRWNQCIADRKSRRLDRASRFFGRGLIVLLAVAIVLPILNGVFPPAVRKGDKGDRGPQGPPGETVVHASQVRAVFASPVVRAQVGRPLRVRYAATHVGVATIVLRLGHREMPPIVETTTLGANGTNLVIRRPGRYEMRLTVMATNGSTTNDVATVDAK